MTNKRLLIDATHQEETRVVIADEYKIYDFDISSTSKTQNKGNIYLAKITRVEPSLQAAFVEYGAGRQGFLPFSEIHPDYYQIPVADREQLLKEIAAEVEAEADLPERSESSANQEDEQEGRDRNRGRRHRRRGRGRFGRRDRRDDRNEERGEHRGEEAASGEFAQAQAEDGAFEEGVMFSPDMPLVDAVEHENVATLPAQEPLPEAFDDEAEEEGMVLTKADAKTIKEETAKAEALEQEEAQAPAAETAEPAEEAEEEPVTYAQSSAAQPDVMKSDIVEETEEEAGAEVAPRPSRDKREKSNDDSNVVEIREDKMEIESLGDDDDFTPKSRSALLRRYKIQEVIHRGQVMLVQVVKEERGNKGASLTSYISLAGRYCVLMPNSPKTGGISRKISNVEDRKRLKAISEEMRSEDGMSAIIRTAGIDRTRAEIKRDYDYLIKLWNTIRETTLSSTAPAVIYEEADIVKRSLRDLYSNDIKEVVVAGEDAHKRAKEFMKLMMPSHTGRIKLHAETTPIFYAYDVEDHLLKMHEPQVKLESGGSIVINPTEALVSIDVNSGRSTTERNVEETALKTNLEAAQEIARQLRLRDLAGLIVIDFIDMFDYKNRRAVEKQLKDALKSDRAKIQVGRISAFGLLEMSRQRLRPSYSETNTQTCPHCDGRGFVLNAEAQGIQLLRFVEKEASSGEYAHLKLKVTTPVALFLLNNKRERLAEMEKLHNIRLTIEIGEHLTTAASFILERYTAEGQKTEVNGIDGIPSSSSRKKSKKNKKNKERSPNHQHERGQQERGHVAAYAPPADDETVSEADDEAEETTSAEDGEAQQQERDPRNRRNNRRGMRNRNNRRGNREPREPREQDAAVAEATPSAPAQEKQEQPAETGAEKPEREPRPRGRRRSEPANRERKEKAETSAEVHPLPAKPAPEAANDAPAAEKKPSNKKGWWRRIVE